MNFDDCLRMEQRIASRFLTNADFYEGVRSVIIDKDYAPKWKFALENISKQEVMRYFGPLNEAELAFN